MEVDGSDFESSERADRVQFSPLERDLLRTFASLLGNIPKGLYESFGRGLDYGLMLNLSCYWW